MFNYCTRPGAIDRLWGVGLTAGVCQRGSLRAAGPAARPAAAAGGGWVTAEVPALGATRWPLAIRVLFSSADCSGCVNRRVLATCHRLPSARTAPHPLVLRPTEHESVRAQELASLHRNPPATYDAGPTGDDISGTWQATIVGPVRRVRQAPCHEDYFPGAVKGF